VGQDSKVAIRPVTVSQQDEVQAVIAKGLQSDERVVTTGFARLTADSKVAVTNAEAVPPPGAEPASPPPDRRRGSGRKSRGDQQRSDASPSPSSRQ
jgi:multidrug efflux system membrane fusion protein